MNPEDVIVKGMLAETKVIHEVKAKDTDKLLEDILKLVEEIADKKRLDFKDEIKNTKEFGETVTEFKKTLLDKKPVKRDFVQDKKGVGILVRSNEFLKKIHSTSKSSLKEIGSLNKSQQNIAKEIQKQNNIIGKSPPPPKTPNTTNGPLDNGSGGMPKNFKGMMKEMALAVAMAAFNAAKNMSDQYLEAVDVRLSDMFKGGLVESQKLIENIRVIIHETKGFGNLNREIEKDYLDITNAILASGGTWPKYAELYIKNLERGFNVLSADDKRMVKRLKLEKQDAEILKLKLRNMKSIQTTALSTANNLHMEVEGINQLFMDWNMHLGLSALQLGEMGRSIQNIAKSSGITGKQLEQALQKADSIIKSMKKAGVASVDSMKNVNEIMAISEKFGVGDKAAEILSGLTSRQNFLEMDPKLRLLLTKSAATIDQQNAQNGIPSDILQKLNYGALQGDKAGIKQLMEGQNKVVQNMLQGHTDLLIKSGALKDGQTVKDLNMQDLSSVIQKLQKLGPEGMAAAASFRTQLKYLGTSAGDIEQLNKAFEDMSKTPFEKLKEMKVKMDSMENKKTDQFKQLEAQSLQLSTDMSMDAFGRMEKFSSELLGKNLGRPLTEEIKKQMKTELGDLMPEGEKDAFIKDFNERAQTMLSDVNKRAKTAGLDLNKLATDRGKTVNDLVSGLQTGDKDSMLVMQEILQQISRQERVNNDPTMKIRDEIVQYNIVFMDYFKWMKANYGGLITTFSLGFSTLGSILQTGFSLIGGWQTFKFFKGFMGGGKVAEVAGKGSGLVDDAGKTVAKAGGGLVDDAGKTVAKAGSGLVDDAAKAGSGLVDDVAKAGSGLVDDAAKAGGAVAKGGSLFGEFLSGAASLLGVAIGGLNGWWEAKDAGFTSAQGIGYGMATGGAHKGSMFSETLGLEKGGLADEGLGMAGAAAHGALIGRFFGPIGAALGGLAGETIELIKIMHLAYIEVDKSNKAFAKTAETQKKINNSLLDSVDNIKDPKERAEKLEQLIASNKELLKGQQANFDNTEKQLESFTWLGMISGFSQEYEAVNATYKTDGELLDQTKNKIFELEKKLSETKTELSDPLETTAKTMEMGQKKGSIYVHDTHLEELLDNLFGKNSVGVPNTTMLGVGTGMIDALKSAISEKLSSNTQATLGMLNLGLFDPSNIVDAIREYIINITGDKKSSDVNTNAIDYTDDIKGHVGTLLTNRSMMETNIQKEKYGKENDCSTALLPSIDSIAEYLLNTQLSKFDEIISLLGQIKNNSGSSGNSSTIIGKSSSNMQSITKSGVKNIAKDLTRGFWDLTFGDYSPGQVTTEGRGGSA